MWTLRVLGAAVITQALENSYVLGFVFILLKVKLLKLEGSWLNLGAA